MFVGGILEILVALLLFWIGFTAERTPEASERQRKFKEEREKRTISKKEWEAGKKSRTAVYIIWGLILLALGIGMIRIDVKDSHLSSVSASSEKDDYGHNASYAYVTAEDVVKRKLKSPSTAKFCHLPYATVTRSGNSWTIKGWVDAQNSFGATIRNNFTVKITYSGKNNYTVDYCHID